MMRLHYTLQKADAVAKAEVDCPQIIRLEGTKSKGWSFYYKQHEYGMRRLATIIFGINIGAVVHRDK